MGALWIAEETVPAAFASYQYGSREIDSSSVMMCDSISWVESRNIQQAQTLQ